MPGKLTQSSGLLHPTFGNYALLPPHIRADTHAPRRNTSKPALLRLVIQYTSMAKVTFPLQGTLVHAKIYLIYNYRKSHFCESNYIINNLKRRHCWEETCILKVNMESQVDHLYKFRLTQN
jgi:hypothetical protein